jgi:hypothetical protein
MSSAVTTEVVPRPLTPPAAALLQAG